MVGLHGKAGRRCVIAAMLASGLVGGIGLAQPVPQLWLEIAGITVPATLTPNDSLSLNVRSESWWNWEEDGINLRVAQVQMRKPYTMARYLRQWRRDHACCATKEVKGFAVSASIVGPQRTLVGSCEAGDSFAIHFVKLDSGFVELHADVELHVDGNNPDEAALKKALQGLLARVRAPQGRPSSDSERPAPPAPK
jgi:hypothetical protein